MKIRMSENPSSIIKNIKDLKRGAIFEHDDTFYIMMTTCNNEGQMECFDLSFYEVSGIWSPDVRHYPDATLILEPKE